MDGERIAASVFTLIAGVGIFLSACSMIGANISALGGERLKALFDKTIKSRLIGVGMGAVFTAAVQSSGATTVLVISFVDAGIMSLTQAAAVVFGANIGTTATGQIAALGLFGDGLSASVVFGAFAGVGAFVTAFAKKEKTQKIGGIITGFGMLFVGLSAMSGAMTDFSALAEVKAIFAEAGNPLAALVIGTAFTAAVQSSSVTTAVTVTMVATGLIPLDCGIYMTMGGNIGSCATALFAGLAGSDNAKRVAVIHLLFNVIGVVAFCAAGIVMRAFGTGYGALFGGLFASPEAGLAAFHTAFNVITAAGLLPFTSGLVKLSARIVPNYKNSADSATC